MTIQVEFEDYQRSKCPQCNRKVIYIPSREQDDDNYYIFIAKCKNCYEILKCYVPKEELPIFNDPLIDEIKKSTIERLKDANEKVRYKIFVFGPSLYPLIEDDVDDSLSEYREERAKICQELTRCNHVALTGEDFLADPEFVEMLAEEHSSDPNLLILEKLVIHEFDYVIIFPVSSGSIIEVFGLDYPKDCCVFILICKDDVEESKFVHDSLKTIKIDIRNSQTIYYEKCELESCGVTTKVVNELQDIRISEYIRNM
ncbi:MAG: hypothetical protein ACFE9L_00955 [Candidatus Hodarchaeota archaeon]